MITQKLKFTLSAISLFSLVFVASTKLNAAPVRFSQVTQVVDAKPGKANPGNYTRLRLASDPVNDPKSDGEKSGTKTPQDDRVITESSYEIEQVGDCDCEPIRKKGGFPYWTLLGLAAIPIVIVLRNGDDDPKTPPPTPTNGTPTPTMTMTPTPTMTMTPTKTPTPPTEPIPEPMTILLFGTGLAGVGLAARRKYGRREEEEEEEGEE